MNTLNVTLPKKALEYIDRKAKSQYSSRSAVARAYLLEELNRKMVCEARRQGYSIRKISENMEIPYENVIRILGETQVDEEEEYDGEEQEKTMQEEKSKNALE